MFERDSAFVPTNRQWLAIIVGLVGLLVAGLYGAHGYMFGQAHRVAQQQLEGVAALKSRELERWLDDRRAFLSEAPNGVMASGMARLFDGRDSDAAIRVLQARFHFLHASIPEIRAIWLYDPAGHPMLGSNPGHSQADDHHRDAVRTALETRQPIVVDFHRTGTAPNDVALDIVTPLFVGADAQATAIGYAQFELDPGKVLYPMVRQWPVPSPTAESLLAKREGNEVVFINALRHSAAPPLSLRLPVDTPGLISGRALRGEDEALTGVDYRGEPVHGVVMRIPDTDWLLVAKMDDSEVYADARRNFVIVGAAGLVMLALLLALGRVFVAALHARTREAHFRMLAESGSDVVWLYDLATRRFTYLSPSIERLRGYTVAEAMQQTMQDILTPESYQQLADGLPKWVAAFEAGDASLRTRHYEAVQTRNDGTTVHTEAVATLIADGQGRVTHLQGVTRDISERKAAEAALLENDRQLRKLSLAVEQSPASIVITDLDGSIEYVNETFIRTTGYSREEVLGKNPRILHSGRTPPQSYAALWRALPQGESWEGEFFNKRKDGSEFVELARITPISQADGKITHYLALKEDITESRRNVRRIQALLDINAIADKVSERELLGYGLELAEKLTDSAIGFLHLVNDDQESIELVTWTAGALKGCTAAFDSHYPISRAGIWADCFREKRPVMFNDYPGYAAKHGLPEGHAHLQRLISVPVIQADQARMMMGVGNKAFAYNDQDIETVQLIGNDLWRITSRKRAEGQMADALALQVELNRKLADAQNQLLQSEKMASIGQLAAGVAHELNNPIGFVSSNLGTLDSYLKDIFAITAAYEAAEAAIGSQYPQLDAVRAIKAKADFDYLKTDIAQLMNESKEGLARVTKIVKDLKDFSRAGETESQWADLHQGLDSTLNIVWNELKYKCTVKKEYGDLPQILCMPSQLNQVFMNLLVNAAHAIPEMGVITIRSGRQDDEVFVAISDTGSGIAPEHINRVFEPFFTTKPVGKGTGLGLSLAYSIVQKHQGRIEVQSEPGKGTTFTVWLPIEAREAGGAVSPAPTS